MNFGYPGANTHLENHEVSEESFWPSFTDIMMVIVMVFLLVTVAVILNNWTLISELKNSISAQKVASSLAENRQEENNSLESKLSFLEKQIVTLNLKYEDEKNNLVETKKKLTQNEQALSELNIKFDEKTITLESTQKALTDSKVEKDKLLSVSNTQKVKIDEAFKEKQTLQQNLAASKSTITILENDQQIKAKILAQLQVSLDDTTKEKNELASLSKSQKSKIKESLKAQQQLEKEFETSKSSLATLQAEQQDKSKTLTQVQSNLESVLKEKVALVSLSKTQKTEIIETLEAQKVLQQTLEDKELVVTTLQQEKKDQEEKITRLKVASEEENIVLLSVKKSRSEAKKSLDILKSDYKKVKKSLENKALATEKLQSELAVLNKKQAEQAEKLKSSELALEETDTEQRKVISAMNEKLLESEQEAKSLADSVTDFTSKLEKKDEEILAFKSKQNSGDSQLRSLQGEYDTLDEKYKKLLRPARSSKGKFVVTVSYKKQGRKKLIKLKSSPTASYKVVTKKQLHQELASLKKKHDKDLYLKIIIPENSGLSYNEAWIFTTDVQKKYDYYQ